MPTYPYGRPQSFSFRDKRGFMAVTRVFLESTATPAVNAADGEKIAIAIAGVSRSALVNNEAGTATLVKANGPFTTPTQAFIAASAGAYDSIADKLVLVFVDAAARPHRYQISCPLETIFLADNVQVNKLNAAVALLCSQILAADTNGGTHTTVNPVCSAQGAPLVGFSAAYRARSVTPRRMNTGLVDATGANDIYP